MKHGDKIKFAWTLERVVERKHSETYGFTKDHKVWKMKEGPVRHGIFLGWRSLRDGVRSWEPEAGAIFYPVGPPIRVALVSYAVNRNPVYVKDNTFTIEEL